MDTPANRIPLWIKILYTSFVVLMIAVYWHIRGPAEFLWFSDVALFIGVGALWLESPLLTGMMAVGVLAPELLWNLSFFGRLLTGCRMFALTDYMFDPAQPLILRGISLFHVPFPPLIIWMLFRLGYDPRALKIQTALACVVLPLSWLLTNPSSNVNWVHGLPGRPPSSHTALWMALLMIIYPLCICCPTHLALCRFFIPDILPAPQECSSPSVSEGKIS